MFDGAERHKNLIVQVSIVVRDRSKGVQEQSIYTIKEQKLNRQDVHMKKGRGKAKEKEKEMLDTSGSSRF